jgi:hypothetical protein
MKHLKTFEVKEESISLPDNDIKYYKIEVKKSIDRFNIALDKIGVRELFYDDFNIRQFEYVIIKNDIIYFIIDAVDSIEYGYNFKIEEKFSNLKKFYDEINFGGVITIEDYEVAANKYNL